MASLYCLGSDRVLIRAVSAIVLKGHWDNILKPKIGSCVSSTVINHTLLKLSPSWFALSCSFYKWVDSIPNYKHSLQSTWTMICILTQHKHFKAAQSLLEKIALRDFLSSPSVLKAIVDKDYNSDVNSHALSWLVIFYGKSKMTQDAIQVFEHMRVYGLKPHLHACTVLLNSLVKEKLCHTMWKIYKKMIKVGVVANIHIYNVLIHACCKSGDVKKAEELLSEMEFNGVFPDLITYNTLISLYCKKSMHYEALSVQDRMERSGVAPDIITYNSLIYSYCKEGRMREALRLFEEIKGASPNQVTYTTLIDGYCRASNLDEALRLREVMEAKGLYPGVATYNSILRKLCEEGRIKDANRLLNEMSEKKIEPDNITCNTLINTYCKIGDMQSAMKVQNKMLEGGLKPDSFTYKANIHGFCRAREINSAKEMLYTMLGAGFSPSYCTYSWLVDVYVNKGDDEGVIKLLEEFVQRGICVDVSIFRAVIRRLCKREKVECAERVFSIMHKKGILGDSIVYASLAYAYINAGDVVEATKLLDEMYKRRLMITLDIYKSFNASYSGVKNNVLNVFWDTIVEKDLISKTISIHIQQMNLNS